MPKRTQSRLSVSKTLRINFESLTEGAGDVAPNWTPPKTLAESATS